jgi:alkylated DNA repair dioxygenase AlkB
MHSGRHRSAIRPLDRTDLPHIPDFGAQRAHNGAVNFRHPGTRIRGARSASVKNVQKNDLFAAPVSLPAGLVYAPELLTPSEEAALVARISELRFRAFQFHGFEGKRRVVSFGRRYDFGTERLRDAEDIPDFLLDLRRRAGALACVEEADLQHALVTEYAPGAAIGWHRDKGVFDKIVGISLLAPCTFRLRRSVATGWQRASIVAEPRSAYLLDGPSRTEWEHSIPSVDALRFSITFRNLRTQP